MSSASPKSTSNITKSPNLIRYYVMWGLTAVAVIFLVLAFVCKECSVAFILAFCLASIGAIVFHTILNHQLKGYYTGPVFTKKAIDREWEAKDSPEITDKAKETDKSI